MRYKIDKDGVIIRPGYEGNTPQNRVSNQIGKDTINNNGTLYYNNEKRPANYLAKAIVSTVFFFPFGIPAIVNASKVDRLWRRGNYAQAIKASAIANRWCKAAMPVGIVLLVVFCYLISYLMASIV